MSSPFAWSSFRALITGGMNAPSEGAPKMTMESLSRVWDWDGDAASAGARTAAYDKGWGRIEIILPPAPTPLSPPHARRSMQACPHPNRPPQAGEGADRARGSVDA